MSDQSEILAALMNVLGEEGCGMACEEAELYHDDDGWKIMLEGFMEPWNLGQSVEEAKASIKAYAAMGMGLG